MTADRLAARWQAALDDLAARQRLRSLRPPHGADFTSNDYLGYGARWVDAAPTGLPRSGMAARLLRGHHPVWHEVEDALAAWHGAEAALMFPSGYAANEGLLATICEPGDWVAHDELVHACVHDGLRAARCRRAPFRHNDLGHLEELLAKESSGDDAARPRLVVVESLYSMEGDVAPLAEIVALAERHGAAVAVDEAHATGCFGPAGRGLVDAAGLRARVLATVHTGGKALAAPGAYVAGSRLLRDYLVNRCRQFVFTTALPPACGAWWREALARVAADDAGRTALHANARRFRAALAARGIPALGTEHIVPVALGSDARAVAAAEDLQERGFDVRAIRPPTVPAGTARLRVSVHRDHEPELLDRLAAELAEAVRRLGPE